MLQPDELDPSLDAVVAAPQNHTVLFENQHVRVLEVVIQPGERETFHTHAWQSVFLVVSGPRLRYFVPKSEMPLLEIPSRYETSVLHLAPEGLHSLENTDSRRLYAFRIELKHAPAINLPADAKGPQIMAVSGGHELCLEAETVRVCYGAALDTYGALLPSVILSLTAERTIVAWAETRKTIEAVRAEDVIIGIKYLYSPPFSSS